MTQLPDTRHSLIIQVQDPSNREAWEKFSTIYRPVVYRLARSRGLQDADAEDLSQQVLMAIARAIPDWKQHNPQTRFRHWLQRIAKNAILNALTRRPKDVPSGQTETINLLTEVAVPNQQLENQIELEYQRQVYRRAAEIVRETVHEGTWRAFVHCVVEGESTESVAQRTGKTIGNVHAARSRIMKRLQDVVRELEEADE